jgi:outer membrane beta-barrel protein
MAEGNGSSIFAKASVRGLCIALLLATQVPRTAQAVVIQFPDSELAAESVLPVFDNPEAVKSRNVGTAHRVELGLSGGYSLTEAFANPMSIGANLSYHINEDHGINLFFNSYLSGVSDYARQLNPVPGTTVNLNLQYAPMPKYLALANYQFNGYYGKMSLTKEAIVHLSLYGLLGGGMMGIGDSSRPVVSAGLGQKFYLTPSFGLRFDLRFLAYQGPDALSTDLSQKTDVQPSSAFSEKLQFGSLLSFGAVYLFPAF